MYFSFSMTSLEICRSLTSCPSSCEDGEGWEPSEGAAGGAWGLVSVSWGVNRVWSGFREGVGRVIQVWVLGCGQDPGVDAVGNNKEPP